MISPQRLSELRWLWPSVPWRVACELVSGEFPTLCLDSGIVSPLRLRLVKGVCVFRCNLPSELLAEWPGSFTCHSGNTEAERTQIKSKHTKLTLEMDILPPPLPGFELATFRARVRCSYQQAIPAACCGWQDVYIQLRNNLSPLFCDPVWWLTRCYNLVTGNSSSPVSDPVWWFTRL